MQTSGSTEPEFFSCGGSLYKRANRASEVTRRTKPTSNPKVVVDLTGSPPPPKRPRVVFNDSDTVTEFSTAIQGNAAPHQKRGYIRYHTGQRTAKVRLSEASQDGTETERTLILVGKPASTTDSGQGPQKVSASITVKAQVIPAASTATAQVVPTVTAAPVRVRTVVRPAVPSTGQRLPTVAREPGHAPPAPKASSSRLSIVKSAIVAKGFTPEVARRMTQAHRKSTNEIYDSRWKIYAAWCDERGEDPVEASTPLIAEFLSHGFEKKKQGYHTLVGYRTVICKTILDVSGRTVPDYQLLSSLLKQMGIERPPHHNKAPPWDLALVLRMLQKPPFEPMATAELWAMTWKTVFLTALATAKRRGELHAFLAKVERAPDWAHVTLKPDPLFLAKTEQVGKPGTRMQPVLLKSLSRYVGSDLPMDAKNCVVRALRIYLNRSGEYRHGRQRLFISYKKSKTDDIVPATISNWVKKTVRYVYDSSDTETRELFRVRAHDVRAMSTSWSACKNVPVGHILDAAQWRCHNTFTSFYLMDMTSIEEDMFKLGPIVAAQSIISGAE